MGHLGFGAFGLGFRGIWKNIGEYKLPRVRGPKLCTHPKETGS